MEPASIYPIAKNCRTNVEMIGKYHAAHIKTNLDASEINKMRPRPKKNRTPPKIRHQATHPNTETDVQIHA